MPKSTVVTKRCSKCGKKVRLLKDGTISSHRARTMGSRTQFMSRPDLDDYITTVHCSGSYENPHKGRWRGEVGFHR